MAKLTRGDSGRRSLDLATRSPTITRTSDVRRCPAASPMIGLTSDERREACPMITTLPMSMHPTTVTTMIGTDEVILFDDEIAEEPLLVYEQFNGTV